MEGIKITKKPKLKNPYLIAAWPGMGEVAFKAASYLVESLKAEEFALLLPEDFFYLTGSVIHNGILDLPEAPQSKFYYWKNKAGKNDLIIFLSNAQPDLSRAEEYSRRILGLAKQFGVELIISLASMPQPIEHGNEPKVWITATTVHLNNSFKKYNLNILNDGQISGMNGLFLGIAKKEGLKGICLLGEIPLYTIQIENPKASQAVLGVLGTILNIQIDFTKLKEQAQTMEAEINKLLDFLRGGSEGGQPAPIGEDEIERIKKTLSQLTRLPASMKDKIENLFLAAKTDIAKAHELKTELDKWNVYKEYEDRFLDLFKKSKDKGN